MYWSCRLVISTSVTRRTSPNGYTSTPTDPMRGLPGTVQSKLGTYQKQQAGIIFSIGSATRRYGVWCRTIQTVYAVGSSPHPLSSPIKTKRQSRLSSPAAWVRACAESAGEKGTSPVRVGRPQRHTGSTRCRRRLDRFSLHERKGARVTSLPRAGNGNASREGA